MEILKNQDVSLYPNIVNYYNGIKGNKTKQITVNLKNNNLIYFN